MCCLPLWTAMVRPTKSGRTVERRDQVLIGRLSLAACAVSTFFMRCPSTNGPFLIERAMVVPYAFLWRLRPIITWGRLLGRGFFPFAGWPPGETRWGVARVPAARGGAARVLVPPRPVGGGAPPRVAPALL